MIRKKRYIFIVKVQRKSEHCVYQDHEMVSLPEGFQILDMVGAEKRGQSDQANKQRAPVFEREGHIVLEYIHHYIHYC